MRRLCTLLRVVVFCSVLPLPGCVDREYSLDNIEESQIRVGNVITTPPVTAHLSFEGLMGGISEIERILEENGLTLEDLGKVPVDIGQELFLVELPLDIPLIPDSMTDIFEADAGSDDKTELILGIRSTLPMSVAFGLEFTDSQGAEVMAFDELLIEASENGEEHEAVHRQEITDLIRRLPEIKAIKVTLLRPDAGKINFLLDNYIEIETRVEKTGGIELF